MAVKNTTQVLIGGKIVTLSGYESEEYLQKVANYMNNKLTELGQIPGYNRQALETRHTLLSLNIADDYFKAKRQAEMYEEELEAKDREMYDLKHDLINGQVELEKLKEAMAEKEQQLSLLQAKAQELEKELDELLK
ncbi:MAG TPA: cell division protein ZapA [Candidatus Blautia pullicola]|jgi:cell division protein ZapA|uniref:Cell division protein ZapA n=1 Tax=Candidatus Blautia pullicola TaxID=2838498 RepID=A0A9D2FS24_9FIRM|nr:cell division protein ZapA [Candidatus Blautia pullicola]